MNPVKVTTKDISSVRYLRDIDSYTVRIYVSKGNEKGFVEFSGWESKKSAQDFFKKLKASDVRRT